MHVRIPVDHVLELNSTSLVHESCARRDRLNFVPGLLRPSPGFLSLVVPLTQALAVVFAQQAAFVVPTGIVLHLNALLPHNFFSHSLTLWLVVCMMPEHLESVLFVGQNHTVASADKLIVRNLAFQALGHDMNLLTRLSDNGSAGDLGSKCELEAFVNVL